MGFISILLGNKNLVIGLLLLASLGGMYFYTKILKAETVAAKAEATAYKNDLQVSEESNKVLKASIDSQNAAVDALKADADKRQAANKVELDKAKKTSDFNKIKAQDIMNRPLGEGVNACSAADVLINSEIQNAK